MSIVVTLSELADRFDGFLIDQFGVLMDGGGLYEGVVDQLSNLQSRGKEIVLLSNSGRRAQQNIDRLLRWGVNRNSFITVQSSGESAYKYLSSLNTTNRALKSVYLISRENDLSPVNGLGLQIVDDPSDADLVVIAGSEPEKYNLEYYESILKVAAVNKIPAVCSNPDRVMLTGQGPGFGAAVIAESYEKLGGEIRYVGKPYPAIYEDALAYLPNIDREKVICIGDSLHHDLKGAQNFGLSCAMVQTGLLEGASEKEIVERAHELGLQPDFILPRFSKA